MKTKSTTKKVLNIVATILAVLFALIMHSIAAHHIYSAVEGTRYKKPGDMVSTINGDMHVYTEINKVGAPTYIFLTAFGGGSAYYDFKMLWDKLSDEANIVTIDYLGYGMSDTTQAERTLDNIVEEISEALKATGAPAPYTIVSHSMGGYYATGLALKYPKEVESIVFIDNTPPALTEASDGLVTYKQMKTEYDFLKFTGLIRLIGSSASVPGLTDDEIAAYTYYVNKTAMNDTIINEVDHAAANAAQLRDKYISEDIPILILCSAQNEAVSLEAGWDDTWVGYHEDILNCNSLSRVVVLETGHYIHWEAPEQVIEEIGKFVNEIEH